MKYIGGGWYLEKCAKKRTKLNKNALERHDLIRNKLVVSFIWWNDWKFQLHWNVLEWVDPKSTPKRVKPFSFPSKKLYINNNDRTAHFVGHSKLTPLDIVEFKKKHTNKKGN